MENDVFRILREWELDIYQQDFQMNNIINVADLLNVLPIVISDIIDIDEDQLSFWKKWVTWSRQQQQQQQQNVPAPTQLDKYVHLHKKDELPTALKSEITKEKFLNVLKQHRGTSLILAKHDYSTILRKDRAREVANVIVDHLLNISIVGWNADRCQNIVDVIKRIFKNEIEERYFQLPFSGLIATRIRNQKSYLTSLVNESNKTKDKVTHDVNTIVEPVIKSDKVRASLAWLKESHGTLEDSRKHWKDTYTHRKEWVESNKMKTVDDIFKSWNIVTGPYGGQLILDDFDQMFDVTKIGSIKNWNKFIESVEKFSKCNKRDRRCKNLKDLLEVETLSNDVRVILGLMHLAHLHPALGNISLIDKNSIPKSKKLKKRQSTGEATEASDDLPSLDDEKLEGSRGVTVTMSEQHLAVWAATEADITRKINERISEAGRASVQPYIIAVGGKSMDQAETFYVILDKVRFKVGSGLEAVDLCYKMYHVFDAHYPPAARHIWKLIECGLYKMNTTEKVKPYMATITKQVYDEKF